MEKDVTINLKMPGEINSRRKSLKLSWRKLIMKGLAASEAESHIKEAAKSLMKAYTLIKENS
jgi:hypothetical protein